MRKERFGEFCDAVCAFDYIAAGNEVVLRPNTVVKVCLYLSKEKLSYIEYGDFEPDAPVHELHDILKTDGYLDETGCVTDKVHEMLAWQVWVKYFECGEYEPYAGIYLFDFDDNGISEVNEFQNLNNLEE